jgi:hypothetical protein
MDRRNELIDAIIACKFPNYWLALNAGAASEDEQLTEIELRRDIDAERDRLARWSEDDLEMELDFASDAEQRQSRLESTEPAHDRPQGKAVSRALQALEALSKEHGGELPFSTKATHRKVEEWLQQVGLEGVSQRTTERALKIFKKKR